MISRTAFCSAQAARMLAARTGPMPATSRSRSGVASMTSNTFSPKAADTAIAMKLGIEKAAMIRILAGISYALTEAMDEGHCGLPTEELIPLAEKLLEVPQELIRTALDLELQEGTVVADRVGETPCVFLAGLDGAERAIAERLMRIANGTLPWPWIDPDKALPWV